MNTYQEFIRKIETQFRQNSRNNLTPYLCVLAQDITNDNTDKYKECCKRFKEEMSLFAGEDEIYTTLNFYLHKITKNIELSLDRNIVEYRLLVLHRMYEDANYDYWMEE